MATGLEFFTKSRFGKKEYLVLPQRVQIPFLKRFKNLKA